MNKSYVTYDTLGNLTGGFLQEILPEHSANHILVDDNHRLNFPMYKANAARNGLEVLGSIAPPLPTVPEYTAAIQVMLDSKAHERNYDNILSACTYATSTVAKFKAEGQACVDWRDAVWSKAYDLLAQVQSGAIAQPTLAEILAMLPLMVWPA